MHFHIDDHKMKLTRLILSLMVVAVMTPVYADNNDLQQQADNREAVAKQRAAVAAQTMASSQGRGMHFMPIPTIQPKPVQPPPVAQNTLQPIVNRPVGSVRDNHSDNHLDNHQNYQRNNGIRRLNRMDVSSHGDVRTDHPHDSHNDDNRNDVGGYGYSRPNNTTVIYGSRIRTQDVRDNDGYGNHGWENHYRMPYRSGNDGRYTVRYVRSWPINYGWRAHGWRVNYRTVDPYWFAVITSIAVAQAWSDAEIAQAINDDHLRQQLLYDADLRHQMVDSGYPSDQLYYLDQGSNGYASPYPDDQGAPYSDNQRPYLPQYDQGQGATQVIQTTQSSYYPPPNQPAPSSMTPNSPLYAGYQGVNMPSGEQIANLNANKNALFFCSAGNKQSTALALRSVIHPDLSVWKAMDAYNRCAMWASTP
jgi:hypothetical protein